MGRSKSKGCITEVSDGISKAYYLNNKKIADDGLESLIEALGYEFAAIDADDWDDGGDGFPDNLDDMQTID